MSSEANESVGGEMWETLYTKKWMALQTFNAEDASHHGQNGFGT